MPLAEFEVSLIREFIIILHSTMAMPQAILELTNVDSIVACVDIFTEAIPDSSFKFADVSFIKFHTLERYLPDAVHSSVNNLAFISLVFRYLYAIISIRFSCLVCSRNEFGDATSTFTALGLLGELASSVWQFCLCVAHTLVFSAFGFQA